MKKQFTIEFLIWVNLVSSHWEDLYNEMIEIGVEDDIAFMLAYSIKPNKRDFFFIISEYYHAYKGNKEIINVIDKYLDYMYRKWIVIKRKPKDDGLYNER